MIKTNVIYLIVSTNELTEIQIGGFLTKNNANEKWLGVNIDSKLNFDCHINHLCNKANTKLSVYDFRKKKIVMNSFFIFTVAKIIIKSHISS